MRRYGSFNALYHPAGMAGVTDVALRRPWMPI
jgi:hypothetical protein